MSAEDDSRAAGRDSMRAMIDDPAQAFEDSVGPMVSKILDCAQRELRRTKDPKAKALIQSFVGAIDGAVNAGFHMQSRAGYDALLLMIEGAFGLGATCGRTSDVTHLRLLGAPALGGFASGTKRVEIAARRRAYALKLFSEIEDRRRPNTEIAASMLKRWSKASGNKPIDPKLLAELVGRFKREDSAKKPT